MPRPRGAKNKASGRRFKPYEGRYPDDKHLRLTKDMLLDPAYISLSASAKTLYSYMKLWACGRDTVVYAASVAKDIMARQTFVNARDELVEAGFIEYLNKYSARDKKEAAEYAFSSQWHNKAYSLPKRIDSG